MHNILLFQCNKSDLLNKIAYKKEAQARNIYTQLLGRRSSLIFLSMELSLTVYSRWMAVELTCLCGAHSHPSCGHLRRENMGDDNFYST